MVGYLSLRVSGFNVADLHILNTLKPPIDWTGEDGEGLSVLCDATQLPIGPPDVYHVSRPRVCLRNQSSIGRSDAYHVLHSRAVRRGSGLCPVKFRKALCRRAGVIFHALHLKKMRGFLDASVHVCLVLSPTNGYIGVYGASRVDRLDKAYAAVYSARASCLQVSRVRPGTLGRFVSFAVKSALNPLA